MQAKRAPTGASETMTDEARRSLLARRAFLLTHASTEATAQELVELNEALARLDAGTWGRCERCGGAVGRDRLRSLPETRFCLVCSRR